jgi:antitoxin (DNA-binding transcriptional repressor) of toxin-antitoxin stability system
MHRLSATAAARGFSDLLNRVEYRGETILIERNGHTVCTIAPATPSTCTAIELWEVLKTIPRADPKFADDLERIARRQARVARSPWER